ncbi:MAG TPA: peptidylprolyl isomerase [Chloroflexota bacterium]|jgi:cyclophilin family peptidyl-prolyl cis-trans isomerase|nr:peptidylprolyl isomerase [Chloroflexota bacterium]
MSSGSEGPQGGSRGNRPEGSQRRSGTNPASGRGPTQPPRSPRPSQARTSRQIEERRRAQREAARRRTLIGVTLVGLALLIAIIVAVVALINNHNGSASPPATATAAATVPAAPTTASSGAAIPSAPLTASAPTAAEQAASRTACAPFLAAGQDPTGHNQWGKAPKQVIDASKHYQVKIYTDKGTVTADILPKLAPITANNFVFLACNGYYNNTIFHRTIVGFMIQGGDPTGTGTGGPGYTIPDEKVARAYQVGDLAMANTGQPNSGGSQFFVIQGAQGVSLPQSYALFGHVTRGQNVVDAIATAPTHAATQGGENSSPNTPVHIRTITLQVS